MLFLNTLQVSASVTKWTDLVDTWVVANGQISPQFTFTVVPSNSLFDIEYVPYSGSGSGRGVESSTGSYSETYTFTFTQTRIIDGVNYYNYHIVAPANFVFTPNVGLEPNDLYGFVLTYSTLNVTNGVSVSNFSLKNSDGSTFSANLVGNVLWMSGKELLSGQNDGSIGRIGYIEFDMSFSEKWASYDNMPMSKSFTVTPTLVLWCGHVSDTYIDSAIQVQDTVTQQELSTLNDTTEDTNTTTHSIFDSISSFFGSFFDNLIGVFVPEDGYFSDWFNRVNTLLSAKLGMLYAPFDLLISTLQAIYDSDDTEDGIPFPGIKWEDTWLVEPTTFYFSSLGDSEGVTKLRDTVYFGTDVVLLFCFLFLLERKIKHILEE